MEDPKNMNKIILCPCISGALYRMKMLRVIGPINKQYYQYNSCPEFGFRAQLDGWKCYYAESAKMWHLGKLRELCGKELQNREEGRIWNILRFFPKDQIEEALSLYVTEERKGIKSSQRSEFIESARKNCPPMYEDEIRKSRVFRDFIEPN